jgi:urate oxidase / 2-oxo-4-hydroxy-4-carboxy-5-ureidoimidazoline decarboxylase
VVAEISYGKAQVPMYRTYAKELSGLRQVPESAFEGRQNILFGVEVDVEVFGDNFMPAYTHGDNSNVVATDTMKNFILSQGLSFTGATLESFLHYLGSQFLGTYPQMHRLRITGREQPFDVVPVPGEAAGRFTESEVLFSRSHNHYAYATLEMERGRNGDIVILDHRCGHLGLQLIKVTGSSFASFVRDEYTTLPERVDRPLFIFLDVYWKYGDTDYMVSSDLSKYVAAEQVRDVVRVTFHRFVSMSIQHLVNEMGTTLLARFPEISEVAFDAQNRLWDLALTSEADEQIKVYTDPRPPYGLIHLTLSRDT